MTIKEKVISCFGNVDVKSAARMSGCSLNTAYNYYRMFGQGYGKTFKKDMI